MNAVQNYSDSPLAKTRFCITAEEAKSIWELYKQAKAQTKVIRSGFADYGVYSMEEQTGRGESDAEHAYGVAVLAVLLSRFIPNLNIDLNDIFLALFHDTTENGTGDMPDDGNRDEEEKKRIEKTAYTQTVDLLPVDYSDLQKIKFSYFQERLGFSGSLMFALDKMEAVLQCLIYESYGKKGDLAAKKNPSKRDLLHSRLSGSNNMTEIWLYGLLLNTPHNEEIFPLFQIAKAAYEDLKKKWPEWAIQYEENGAIS